MEVEKLNVESIIVRLLEVRGSRPGKKVQLTEGEIRALCLKSRKIFLSQPILLELEAPLKICGDIHGQYFDLLRLFEYGGFPPEANYLFLGNYVDHGRQSLETICLLLAYKIKYPENFFLLRGNHECASINRLFGFYDECKRQYNIRLCKTFIKCFNCLPVAAIINEKIFCCHGGLSPDLQSMEQIRRIMRPTYVPEQGLLCDLLWANPDNKVMGWEENDSIDSECDGISFSFGSEIVSKFLAKHDMDLVVRGHQVVEDGYEFFAKRQLVTLFSAPNFKGEYDNAAGMMSIDETLMCSFQILKPASDHRKMGFGIRSREIQDDSSSIDSFQETMQKGYTALEPDLFREVMQKGYAAIDLFQEAMQKGYVVLETTVLLLIGVAGAGKTSFCHLLFNEPSPKIRSSTPIARTSIRAMSLTKACVQTEEKEIIWERVTARKLNDLIADGIKSVHTHGAHQTLISHAHSEDELRLHSITLAPVKQPVEDIQVSSNAKGTYEQSVIKPKESVEVDTANTKAIGNSEPIKSDVAQLFEMEHVKELLKTVDSVEGSGEIFKRKWLYIIDTGGQPQFHELLPTFVHHVSAAVLFVKLNELLKAHPMIDYYKDDTLCGKPYKSSYNHLQILQNCLQAMQSRNQMNSSSQCPKLLFVGTHRDKQSWFSSEGLKSKNVQLLEMLLQHDTFCDNLIYCSMGESDQLLYPVNAKNPRSRDKQVAANFRQKVMSQCQTREYKVPIRWFVLEQLLQDLSKDGVVSFDKCVEVAGHLGMNKEKLLAALEYLVQLNIFEYYLKVLPRVVFTTSQVLLDKITELIEYSHLLRGANFHLVGSSDPKFREYGMINAEMLKRERFSSHYISGLFEVKDLLDVWLELLVVAEGKDGNFIVPAVLPDMSLQKLSEYRLSIHSSEVIPIAIHYPGNFFPSGTFSSLVSYLQNKSGDWAIAIKSGRPACLYKNCVNFSVSGNVTANVTLIYSHEWIEVHAIICGKNKKVCLLLDHIFKGLKRAQEIQKYDDFVPELAFFCPFNHGNPPSSHLASPIAPDNDIMQCRRDQTKYSDLSEKHKLWLEPTDVYIIGAKHCVHDAELDTTPQEKIIKPEKLSTLKVSESDTEYSDMSEKHKLWLEPTDVYAVGAEHCVHDAELDTTAQEQIIKPKKLSTLRVSESDIDITSLSSRPRLYELDRIKGNGKTVTIISRTAAVWEKVATRLHFEGHEITCIKKDNHFQGEDACRAMFSKWLEGKGRTPTNWDTVIKALEEANLGEVAQDMKEVLGV